MKTRGACWLWWSSGKDSTWALRELRRTGYDVTRLVTTVNQLHDRVAIHGVRRELLEAQAQSVGLPLRIIELPSPCSNEDYEAAVAPAIAEASTAEVRSMAFGDLFLRDVRAYRERLLAGSEIAPAFPIWGMDTRRLAPAMIAGGLRARLTCVDTEVLPAEFVGRVFDEQLLSDLPDGVDPCGENGEFHTFVYDGPGFTEPLAVETGRIEDQGRFVFSDLTW
ncbi:MAG: ATP-binding protein [Acidobacteria bacterium]|nr:ATP-binding protein [Acidobacteriota bacterium]